MRIKCRALVWAASLALCGAAQAHDIQIHDGQCGYSTDFDVRVTQDSIDFRRDAGHPAKIVMHDGHLSVDGRDVVVSADDAARLRNYESQVRSLLPDVAEIAREGVNIGYAAMRAVLLTFAENDDERHDMVGRLEANHRQVLARIDEGLGKGVWKPHDLDELIEGSIQQSVSDLVGKVTGAAVKAALSGDQNKVAALEARADSLDHTIDKEVNARADQLGKRADALCPRLHALDSLQQQFQFRLQDGSRLRLLSRERDNSKKLATTDDHANAD
ncbi:DUF2884 family protein [Dyella halodurans]|uniref:DUF2884 family protein n=1 Tax=Dyella halodurans TaxID=1920171 RepID=A0ABV9C7D0_9GAMM|nr:DUF2884 family protein [Dyella halodurans]